MSYKVDEQTLIAYLYNELSSEKKGKVEAYLNENEEARKELGALKEARFFMGRMKDQEVDIPRFTFDQQKVIVGASSEYSWWKYPVGIAASITLVFLIGYLTSFRLSTVNGGLQISFGDEVKKEEFFSKEEVESLITKALIANNQRVDQKVNQIKNVAIHNPSDRTHQVNEALLNEYMVRLRNFNRETLRAMFEDSEQSQKAYTDRSLQDLAIYLDIQRQNDLDIIQTRFENFENDAEFNQLQTNQILTNLISSVEEQPSNQY